MTFFDQYMIAVQMFLHHRQAKPAHEEKSPKMPARDESLSEAA